ncbi:FAD-binding oxidoreductase [soil metagenome]
MPSRANVVIIGAGIMGTSIAWALAKRGIQDIVVVEKATVAAGASGKTGALLRRHYTNDPEARLAHLGFCTYRDWPEIVGGQSGYVPEGLVVTVDCSGERSGNIAKLHTNVARLNSLGVDCQVITGDELRHLQPFVQTDDVPFASYEPVSGYVDSIQATRSMAIAASGLGVRVAEQTRVDAITARSGRVEGVATSDGPITASVVICANGAFAPGLLSPVSIDVPITALRVQIAILQRPLELDAGHFVFLDTAAGVFTRPWGPGRSLVGVGGGDQHDEVDPNSYDPRNDIGYGEAAINAIAARIPAMSGASYLHGHAGLYDMTPDAHPIIGETGIEGLYVAAGFSGAGFKKGPAVGICLAALIDGAAPAIDLTRFSLSRFDDDRWRQPWSETEYTFSSDFGHGL